MKTNGQLMLFEPTQTTATRPSGLRESLTFKANRNLGRHGWLRLTPAYSRHLVETLIKPMKRTERVLDPFCGTGTTALTCAEHGIEADTVDINPFLVWLANAKFAHYTSQDLNGALKFAASVSLKRKTVAWMPPIKDIAKWWAEPELGLLAALMAAIKSASMAEAARDLLFSAFCRVAIECAAVSFGHQSMSFKSHEPSMLQADDGERLLGAFRLRVREVVEAASQPVQQSLAKAVLGDSRSMDARLRGDYAALITSPPYPNRMSYIRELRPYMYWLGYLQDGRQAGELDWQAIGGTWGCATSNLSRWKPSADLPVPHDGFDDIIEKIASHSQVLSSYVHKYFEDTCVHFGSLAPLLRRGAHAHYIVGNSKFYDVMLPTEEIYASMMRRYGFDNVRVETIRKRTSKKELFEYVVSGSFAG